MNDKAERKVKNKWKELTIQKVKNVMLKEEGLQISDQLQTQMGNWEIKKLNKKYMNPKGATVDADGYLLKEEERHEHKRRTV